MKRVQLWRVHQAIALAVRFYLGWLFVTASIHKIAHPDAFAMDVATYQFLPIWAVNAFAIVVPWVELGVGGLLVLGLRVRASALLVASMMLAFMVALAWALHLELDMACGCFASQAAADEDPISSWTLVRDTVWLLLSVYVLVFDRRPIGLDAWLFGGKRSAEP
jgi:uncharacterized membrane protein YphA (DoxX/SURF4 family)